MNIIIIDDCKNNKINNIMIASDGLDAINKILLNMDIIDIIFIDNQMPYLTGTIIVKLLREIIFNKLIFGISDCTDDELVRFADSGIDFLFKKPFNLLNREILFNFLNKNDIQRYPNKKLTLINSELIWI